MQCETYSRESPKGVAMRLIYAVVGLLCVLETKTCLAEDTDYPALLGNGYDSLKLEHKMNQCAEGEVGEDYDKVISSKLTRVQSWAQFTEQMNFKVPGSLIINSDSELAKFVLRAQDTDLTSTFIFDSHIEVKRKFLKNPKMTRSELSDAAFREECGNQYIAVTTSGGKLHVGIKFSFSESSFKQEFNAGGAISSLTGLGAHVGVLSDEARKNSSVEIFFHQVGGNLSELNNMFESGDIVSCSLEHFDKCENLFNAVWDYSKDHFAKSVVDGKDQTISFKAEDYMHRPKVYEDPDVKREREKLIDALDRQREERDFLYGLKDGRLQDYEDCDQRCLARLIGTVSSNMRTMKDAIHLSFEDPEAFKLRGVLSVLELAPLRELTKRQVPHSWFIQSFSFMMMPVGVTIPVMIILHRTLGMPRSVPQI